MISSRSVNLYVVRRMALMVALILGTVGWAGVAYLQGRPNWVVLVGCILPVYLIWAWSAGWRDHLTITPRGIEGLRHDRPVAWTELASVQATGAEVVFTPRDPELVPLREQDSARALEPDPDLRPLGGQVSPSPGPGGCRCRRSGCAG